MNDQIYLSIKKEIKFSIVENYLRENNFNIFVILNGNDFVLKNYFIFSKMDFSFVKFIVQNKNDD